MKSIILLLSSSFFFSFFAPELEPEPNKEVTIELLNAENIEFEFSVTHKPRRNQIMVRSTEAMKTLRMVNDDKKKTDYSIMGSNLVVLPIVDFKAGQDHILEVKFVKNQTVIMAKISVPVDYPMPIN